MCKFWWGSLTYMLLPNGHFKGISMRMSLPKIRVVSDYVWIQLVIQVPFSMGTTDLYLLTIKKSNNKTNHVFFCAEISLDGTTGREDMLDSAWIYQQPIKQVYTRKSWDPDIPRTIYDLQMSKFSLHLNVSTTDIRSVSYSFNLMLLNVIDKERRKCDISNSIYMTEFCSVFFFFW